MKEAGRREDYRSARNNKEEERGEEKIMQGLEGQKSQTSKGFLKRHKANVFIFNYLVFTQIEVIYGVFFTSQHSIWHKGKTKWRDDERNLGLFAFLMDQMGLESLLPPWKGCGAKERRLFRRGRVRVSWASPFWN